ncbi:MAG: ankyrin repeat domain-containing protein, partial [Armatimonadota bacterium]
GVSSQRAARVEPLQRAALAGDLDRLSALIADGVPVNGLGPDGDTPLASAIRGGQPEAARALLEAGASPSDHAMRMALRYERWDILDALIRAGGDPEVRGTWSGRSPLELAVERQDMEMVRLLLANGADAGAVSLEGPLSHPALHYAAEHGMREYVELLLEYGADPRKRWMGYAPRELAENSGHDEVARLLAQAEAAMGAAGMMEE